MLQKLILLQVLVLKLVEWIEALMMALEVDEYIRNLKLLEEIQKQVIEIDELEEKDNNINDEIDLNNIQQLKRRLF